MASPATPSHASETGAALFAVRRLTPHIGGEVSALDLSTRIQIVELFKRLSAEMTLVFVSHDIAVVAALCDELVVLQAGRVVEAGPTRGILSQPQHPYTKSLLASVPRMPAR